MVGISSIKIINNARDAVKKEEVADVWINYSLLACKAEQQDFTLHFVAMVLLTALIASEKGALEALHTIIKIVAKVPHRTIACDQIEVYSFNCGSITSRSSLDDACWRQQ